MRKLLLFVILFVYGCSSSKIESVKKLENSNYLITKIKTINSWVIIYAEKLNSQYKIVVRKDTVSYSSCNEKIVVGNYYDLELISRRDNVPIINGIKLQPMNYLDIKCFSYDENTEICIEPENGIYDLYYTENIKGLCYIKP